MAYNLQGLGKKKGFFKKIKKVLKPIYRPIVATVKPFLKPLVAMIPGVGPAAAIAVGVAQKLRMDAKAARAVIDRVDDAPGWATMTPAEQQAVINAITAGVVPSIKVPPDVTQAYQQAIQQQAAAHPEWGRPAPGPPGAPGFAPEEAPAEAGIMGGGMAPMLGIGAAALVAVMMMGGGRR
jgi:hypothetical protein